MCIDEVVLKLKNVEEKQDIIISLLNKVISDIKHIPANNINGLYNKKLLSVEEVKIIFGYSNESQKNYRNRIEDPLPFIQKDFGCKIFYNKESVEKWIESAA